MGLIKAANTPATVQVFSMKDIENQARAILLRARQQAEQLLAAAQVEAEALKEQTRTEGFAGGKAEGLAKGREEGTKAGRDQALAEQKSQLTAAAAALSKAAGAVEASRRDLEAAAADQVLALAISIAQRVTKRQGLLDPATAVANVTEALKLVIHASDVRIAIHPAQKAVLDEALPKIRLQLPSLEHVEVVGDESLAPGGCRVFTAQGAIDGDLDSQLQRIINDLLPEAEAA